MSLPLVGIIANPASGRDIRRLVAHGTVFDNNEKTAIVRRILLGLEAVGISRVVYMPEHDFGIVPRALTLQYGETQDQRLQASPLSMPVSGTGKDSTRAAQMLAELGAGCIITLGGDGTNRAVAKGCGSIPLLPISTGTNNVFPGFLEGTIAGMAAGLIALGKGGERAVQRVPWLEVIVNGEALDKALVDVAASSLFFIGSRAIWDLSTVREVVLARVAPSTIGLSALGWALLDTVSPSNDEPGMHIVLLQYPQSGSKKQVSGASPQRGWEQEAIYQGKPNESSDFASEQGNGQVLVPLAPGLIKWVGIASHQRLALGSTVRFQPGTGTLALDGEREIELPATAEVEVKLRGDGPFVVDVPAALTAAVRAGHLHQWQYPRL